MATNETPSETPGTSTTPPAGETPPTAAPTGTTTETVDQKPEPTITIDDSTKLPDTHPLVKTLATQKQELKEAKDELTDLRAKSAKVTKLEEDLAKRPEVEVFETLKKRADRLEAFAQATGLGKALDSKSFSTRLFESDDKIEDIVKDWNKANPSTTSTALGSAAAQPSNGKHDPNELLRIAAGKK